MPPLCLETTKTENQRIFGNYIAQHGFAETTRDAWETKRDATISNASNKHIRDGITPVEQEADFLGSLGNSFCFADFTDPYDKQGRVELIKYTPEQRLHQACDYAFRTFKLDAFNIEHTMIEGIIRRETANRSFKDDAQDLTIINGGDKYFRNCYRSQEPLTIHAGLSFDSIQIKPIRIPGTELEINSNISIGPAQMKICHIMRLVDSVDSYGKPTFPELQTIRDNPLRYALEPEGAALLVGAYIKDKAMRLERGENPCPDLMAFNQGRFHRENIHIMRIWQQGKTAEKQSHNPNLTNDQIHWLKQKTVELKTEALIRTFNAPEGKLYVRSVHEFMNKVDGGLDI